MENGITENFSENKRKRGRPKKLVGEGHTYDDFITFIKKSGLDGENQSKRSHINQYYRTLAQGVLTDKKLVYKKDNEFSYLICYDPSKPSENVYKYTILHELGRLEDPEIIKTCARLICQWHMKTKDAVNFIHEFRHDKHIGSEEGLVKAIVKTIETYQEKYADVDTEKIQEALMKVSDIF